MQFKAFFDRQPNTIDGFFTLQAVMDDGRVHKYFDRIPVRSGQRGHENTSWEVGQSPIPYGKYRLWLAPDHPNTRPSTNNLTGEFYWISNDMADKTRIKNPDGPGVRLGIGLHWENKKPGTAGCVVPKIDTLEQVTQSYLFFAFLRELGKHTPFIPLEVL